MDATDSFGYWVRRRRKVLDLTQDELAQRVGCAAITLRKIEADERRPSMQMAKRLAQCLGLPDDEHAAFLDAAIGQQAISRLSWLTGANGRDRISNLPAAVTTLVGRSVEIKAIADTLRLGEARLLTLTGPVGVGKTRLALEVGRGLSDHYRDGVFLVALASVQDPSLVVSAVATVLGVHESRDCGVPQSVTDFLGTKQMLLIFDNFEHLLPAAAFLSKLLTTCPYLQLLVTSRARLHLYGEHEFVLSPLPLPDQPDPTSAADSPAVRLFCDRAQAARADFRLTPSLTPAVAQICRRLDGLPLAIELAAARINLFSAPELLQRLERRLPLLDSVGCSNDAPDHSPYPRRLENAIAWSFGLLAPAERRLMARLAVFAGGFCLSAAESICSLPLASLDRHQEFTETQPLPGIADMVGALLEQSLLIRHAATCETHVSATRECLHCPARRLREAADAEYRFSMLETIREYALEQLHIMGELEAMQQQHAEYYAGWTQKAETQYNGPDQAVWLARLEQENGNVRAALGWLLVNDHIEAAASMACALATFWQRHGHYSEGRRWLEQILAKLSDVVVSGSLRARCLQTVATLAYRQGDWQMAQGWLAESRILYSAAGDGAGMARVLFDLGWICLDRAEWTAAMRLNQESLALAREANDTPAVYRALTNLGWAQLCGGEQDAAAALFDEAHEVARRMGHTKGVAVSLTNLGWIALRAGDLQAVARLVRESVHLCHLLGEREVLAEDLEILAAAALAQGNVRGATQLSAAAAALWEALHVVPPPIAITTSSQTPVFAAERRQLTEAGVDKAWRQGKGMNSDMIVAFVLGCENAPALV